MALSHTFLRSLVPYFATFVFWHKNFKAKQTSGGHFVFLHNIVFWSLAACSSTAQKVAGPRKCNKTTARQNLQLLDNNIGHYLLKILRITHFKKGWAESAQAEISRTLLSRSQLILDEWLWEQCRQGIN